MSLLRDFRDFAFKGNLIDLAVGFVLGAAFTGVVTSFVKNILMPVLSYVVPSHNGYESWSIGWAEKPIRVGAFLGDLANFLILAAALFVIVVGILGMIRRLASKPAEATTRECPFCRSAIAVAATRCPHCTSQLAAGVAP